MQMTVNDEVQKRGGARGGEMVDSAEEDNTPDLSQDYKCEVQKLVSMIESMVSIGDYRMLQKKESHTLVRRLKILLMLLEDVKELDGQLPETSLIPFRNFKKALLYAKELLITCSEGSKIYLVREFNPNK